MGIFRLKRKTFGLIPGMGNLAKAVETGSKSQALLGAAKLGGTAAVGIGAVSAAKKLTGETD